jgi:hypothetical protein
MDFNKVWLYVYAVATLDAVIPLVNEVCQELAMVVYRAREQQDEVVDAMVNQVVEHLSQAWQLAAQARKQINVLIPPPPKV